MCATLKFMKTDGTFQTVSQAAQKWNISERRIRVLCAEGKIPGAVQIGRGWRIPFDAVKPADGRITRAENLLASIDEKKRLLDTFRPFTQSELERLNEQFTTEYTYNSNAIEGNTLTLRETDLVLRGLTIDKKPLAHHLEAIGHKEAFDYVVSLAQKNEPLSERVKDIHYLVLADKKEDRGVYRKIPVTIAGASHEPVQPYLIQPKLESLLLDYANDRSHIVTKLARFHIDFEAVHPFIDGNGRTGRLLVNRELMKAGYPPINIKFADRLAYYDAFDAYHVHHNLGAMEPLFAHALHERLDFYISVRGK